MTVVAAFLVPGSPLPLLRPDVLPWGRLASAYQRAGRSLAAARPDTLLLYSTQWLAVLDQLWQTRAQLRGVHVDENWHEFGELAFDIRTDGELSYACIAATANPPLKLRSKAVNYDHFPIDSGTITANRFLNPDGRLPLVLASNNLYHDAAVTERLGALAVEQARGLNRKVAVIGVGGLSGTLFRDEIEPRQDRIASAEDDRWNRDILRLIERGDVAALRDAAPEYAKAARVDMGFKHFYWLLGALGGRWSGARVHGYGPTYGCGAAVIELRP